MIPLVPATQQTSAAFAGGWNIGALFQDMVRSWIAHYQRLADLGISGGDV